MIGVSTSLPLIHDWGFRPVPVVEDCLASEKGNVLSGTVVQFTCKKGFGRITGNATISCPMASYAALRIIWSVLRWDP